MKTFLNMHPLSPPRYYANYDANLCVSTMKRPFTVGVVKRPFGGALSHFLVSDGSKSLLTPKQPWHSTQYAPQTRKRAFSNTKGPFETKTGKYGIVYSTFCWKIIKSSKILKFTCM